MWGRFRTQQKGQLLSPQGTGQGLGGSPVQVLVADHRGKIVGSSRGAGLLSEVPLSKVVNPQMSRATRSESAPIMTVQVLILVQIMRI